MDFRKLAALVFVVFPIFMLALGILVFGVFLGREENRQELQFAVEQLKAANTELTIALKQIGDEMEAKNEEIQNIVSDEERWRNNYFELLTDSEKLPAEFGAWLHQPVETFIAMRPFARFASVGDMLLSIPTDVRNLIKEVLAKNPFLLEAAASTYVQAYTARDSIGIIDEKFVDDLGIAVEIYQGKLSSADIARCFTEDLAWYFNGNADIEAQRYWTCFRARRLSEGGEVVDNMFRGYLTDAHRVIREALTLAAADEALKHAKDYGSLEYVP